MKKLFFSLFIISFYLGCSDGDIIVTDFDFEDQTLQRCTDFDFVFFLINPDVNETLVLQFTSSEPFFEEEGEVEIQLSTNNAIVYRRFDGEITADYFCNAIPPASPLVVEEFVSTAGVARLITQATEQDNDGIDADEEGLVLTDLGEVDELLSQDTDGDGLPDFMDDDDDGDNVPTSLEGVQLDDTGAVDFELSQDTDGDGILDYLDDDDDGDGVLTRNEDLDGDLNPTNDRSDENAADDYLNPDIAIETEINEFREHTFIRTEIEVTVSVTNLDFRNSMGQEVIRDITEIVLGTITGLPDITITVTPEFNN